MRISPLWGGRAHQRPLMALEPGWVALVDAPLLPSAQQLTVQRRLAIQVPWRCGDLGVTGVRSPLGVPEARESP